MKAPNEPAPLDNADSYEMENNGQNGLAGSQLAQSAPSDSADTAAASGKPMHEIWLSQLSRGTSEQAIICLPYAGTGQAIFGGWRKAEFEAADLYAAQLPARDGRIREPGIDNATELVQALADAIADSPLRDRPLTLLGCSFGGVVAFELAKELRHRSIQIRGLVVAACRAPQALDVTEPVANLPDEEMVQKLFLWYGAIPAEIVNNEEMLKLVLPAIRADMQVYEGYNYEESEPLACPIISIGGTEDRIVNLNHLTGWQRQTTAKFTCRQFAGDHFFMKTQFKPVLRFLQRQLGSNR